MIRAAIIFLIIIIFLCLIFFKTLGCFVATIDGEEKRKNIELFDDLEYDKVTNSIYQAQDDKSYKLIFGNIDSLFICDNRILFINSSNYYAILKGSSEIEKITQQEYIIKKAQLSCAYLNNR